MWFFGILKQILTHKTVLIVWHIRFLCNLIQFKDCFLAKAVFEGATTSVSTISFCTHGDEIMVEFQIYLLYEFDH